MNALSRVVRVSCLLPFVTGTLDIVQGVRLLRPSGAVIPDPVADDPVLNSQVGFWGAIWFEYGLTLWRASADPRANAGLLRLQFGILGLSGIGRAIAAVRFGRPGHAFTAFMLLELIGAPLLLLWHQVELRKDDRD